MDKGGVQEYAAEFVERLIRACPPYAQIRRNEELAPFVKECGKFPPDLAAATVVELFRASGDVVDSDDDFPNHPYLGTVNYHVRANHALAVAELAAKLLRPTLPLTRRQVAQILREAVRLGIVLLRVMPHIPALVRFLEKHWREFHEDEEIREQLARLEANARVLRNAAEVKLAMRIERLLRPVSALPMDAGEAWTDKALADLRAMDEQARADWKELLFRCREASSSTPNGKWLKQARECIESIGLSVVRAKLFEWFPLVDLPRTRDVPGEQWRDWPFHPEQIKEQHGDVLKGLCWIAALEPNAEMARALGALAISCYRRIPRVGPRIVKVGNAAVYALGAMPGPDSLAQLARLRIKVKFGTAQKMLAKALDAAAQRENLPRDEIEEMAVPAYGLSEVGVSEERVGEHRAVLRISGTTGRSAVTLSWINDTGKALKSVPAGVKRDHADELKELRATAKDLQQMLPAQRDRIDSLFLEEKTWPYETWRQRYLDHPLVGTIARRLIWVFEDDEATTAAMWLRDDPNDPPHGPGRLVRVDGSAYEPAASASVSLWHPIHPQSRPGSTDVRSDVLAWREFLEANAVTQPFKQAHREVYLLTEAERETEVYSNRFAAHILRQHQFSALAAQRGWKYQLRLGVDADYQPPQRVLKRWGLRAEFWVETIGDEYSADFVTHSSLSLPDDGPGPLLPA